jgi:hypothetical protein
MNPNLQKLAEETKNPDVWTEKVVERDGFKYVYFPGINLYVPEKNQTADKSWHATKLWVQEVNGLMLTLPEWWHCYDVCRKNPVGVEWNEWEWIDSVICHPGEHMIYHRTKAVNDVFYEGEMHRFKPFHSDGGFYREDVDDSTGLPLYSRDRGGKPFSYLEFKNEDVPTAIRIAQTSSFLISSRSNYIEEQNNEVCCRICFRPEDMK